MLKPSIKDEGMATDYWTRLRRVFLLIDADHGLKAADEHMLDILHEAGTAHQIVLSKSDKILYPYSSPPTPIRLYKNLVRLREQCDKIRAKVLPEGKRSASAMSDIICCSSEKSIDKNKRLGLDDLRWAVLKASGLEADEMGRKQSMDSSMLSGAADENGLVAWRPVG
jgi:GTP-binding protein